MSATTGVALIPAIHGPIAQISEKDAEALKFLQDITSDVLDGEDENGFKLTFFFDTNPFFENTVLVRVGVCGCNCSLAPDLFDSHHGCCIVSTMTDGRVACNRTDQDVLHGG